MTRFVRRPGSRCKSNFLAIRDDAVAGCFAEGSGRAAALSQRSSQQTSRDVQATYDTVRRSVETILGGSLSLVSAHSRHCREVLSIVQPPVEPGVQFPVFHARNPQDTPWRERNREIRSINFGPGKIVRETAKRPGKVGDLSLGPADQCATSEPLPRRIDLARHRVTRLGCAQFPLTTISVVRVALDQSDLNEFRDLPADGAVIASHTPGKFDHADWPEPLGQHQQRKRCAIESDSCFGDQHFVSVWPIDEGDDLQNGVVQCAQHIAARCIMHGY